MKHRLTALILAGLGACAAQPQPVARAAEVVTLRPDSSPASRPSACPARTDTLYVPPLPQPGFVPAPAGGSRVVAPRRLLAATPVWPSASVACREHGKVTVSYCVSASGEVENAQVLMSSGYARLDNAVLAWVARDRHTAGTVNGRPRRYCGMVAEQTREAREISGSPVTL